MSQATTPTGALDPSLDERVTAVAEGVSETDWSDLTPTVDLTPDSSDGFLVGIL